jgi:hypothetical protein
VCPVKPSFPDMTVDDSFDSVMRKPIQISMMHAGESRSLANSNRPALLVSMRAGIVYFNTLLELAKVSVSLDLLSACSPNGK